MAEGKFALQFSDTQLTKYGECDRFFAMHFAQKYELLLKAKALRRETIESTLANLRCQWDNIHLPI